MGRLKKNCILICIGLFLTALQAQSTDYLIQLKPKISFSIFAEKMQSKMLHFSVVDKEFGIYRITLDGALNRAVVLQKIRATGTCVFYQKMNVVKNRSIIPDDPLFAQQKYLQVVRAADLWAKTNVGGGLTRKGDTIVVAIIDSGMDTMQVDLIPNFWYNRHEIPWNGLDDDSNGYVDDYRGWNGGDTNNKTYTAVSLDGHGTAIAGEIGGKGNNDTGITGLNWNIKLMPIVCYPVNGATDDAGVVRSLIYAFRMKKMYLQSGGKKGANIVAVNTSIGIDFAFPSDAPIWCALYDSLGSVGVVSAAATSNNNVDVDVKGDIPSTCKSEFTVVVSNLNVNDVRESSGFADTSVDMGAPGQDVLTTALSKNVGPNGPFGNQSGTSFAAPLVAGEIALLYQNVCDTFLALTWSKPDSAARLMKQWVMAGTDPLAVLNGKCVTGGRLNMLKAWQALNNWCTAHDQYYSTVTNSVTNITVLPNPLESGSGFEVANCRYPESTTLVLLDCTGRNVPVKYRVSGLNSLSVATQNLPVGTYFLRIQSGDAQLVRKLLIY